MKTFLGTLATFGLLTFNVGAQITVDTVLTNGLYEPYGVAVDANNIVYLTDSANHRVVRFDPNTGVSSTLAGIPGVSGNNDGPSYLAHFFSPQGIVLATVGGIPGLVVSDTGNHTIRFVSLADGSVSTLAGKASTTGGTANAANTNATFRFPVGLALDGDGILYIADSKNNAIRQINLADPNFGVTNLVISGTTLREPNDVTVMSTTQLWIADTKNHAIKLVTRTGPASASLTTLMGSNDQTVFGAADNTFGALARFTNPRGVLWLGNAGLIISDTANQTVRLATNYAVFGATNYAVVTLAGTAGQSGFVNGPALAAKFSGPSGLARDVLGNGFLVADLANSAIRRIQTGPTQPPVADPKVGWVDFVVDSVGDVTSVLRTDQPFVFNNDVTIAIAGEAGTETFFTTGPTPPSPLEDTIPSPTRNNGSSPPFYRDGMHVSEVPASIILPQPDVTIKVIGLQDGRRSSAVVQSRFQFKVANPNIVGDNAALFSINDITANALIFYTVDGSEPTNAAPSVGPIGPGSQISLTNASAVFKMRAFRGGYKPSETVTKIFSSTNYIPNRITFGFASGEASSDFVGSPGQSFYAPVTLSLLPGTRMYSLQFNVTVTNLAAAPPVIPGAVNFISFLEKPDPQHPGIFFKIPPAMFLSILTNVVVTDMGGGVFVTNYVTVPGYMDPPSANQIIYPFNPVEPFLDLLFTNGNNNLLGVGWLERRGAKFLYDTTVQDLIKYSQPHDTLFDEDGGRVVPGGYSFLVPCGAVAGHEYEIRIGRPSATSDGIGTPGSSVYIESPTNGAFAGGDINGVKHVSIGQRKYVVGDAAPFRWFNAGDFGNNTLLNDDVMQVFQSAIYSLNYPPPGSDFFDSMDSCCGTYTAAPGTDYLIPSGFIPNDDSRNPLFDGNDLMINAVAFGDGRLDVTDIYVTFRRSLDPSLQWFQRFWTNCMRVAQLNSVNQALPPPLPPASGSPAPEIKFLAGDGIAGAGSTALIPISAQILGSDPLRLLALGITIEPLDGSPTITVPLQFTANSALGAPTVNSPRGANNFSAAWLNPSIAGLTGDVLLGTLHVTLPANCPTNSAYAIHFDHASASPNGLASFKKRVNSGLVTRMDRSGSSANDGIPDSWRLRYFGTINNLLSQAAADADGDGANNAQECKAGTNPNDASSILRMKSLKGQPHSLSVRWPSVLNKQYVIERAASLYSTWSPVSTNTGTGWDMEYQDSAPGSGSRFYRVRVAP